MSYLNTINSKPTPATRNIDILNNINSKRRYN